MYITGYFWKYRKCSDSEDHVIFLCIQCSEVISRDISVCTGNVQTVHRMVFLCEQEVFGQCMSHVYRKCSDSVYHMIFLCV